MTLKKFIYFLPVLSFSTVAKGQGETQDFSKSNYNSSNTMPVTQKFPVDIYCPAFPENLKSSFYGGISFPFYRSSFSNYIALNNPQYQIGTSKNFVNFNSGYNDLFGLLEVKTFDSSKAVNGVNYNFTRTSAGLGISLQQGIWTKKFTVFITLMPGIYQSYFRSSDNYVNDNSYGIYFGTTAGFKIYFTRNDNYEIYTNFKINFDFSKINNSTLNDGSLVNSNDPAANVGFDIGVSF